MSSTQETATILVAEDDPESMGVVTYGLERAGYRIVRAFDGEQALRLAHEKSPDLAILDVMMPKVNGYEVTKRMRDHDATRHTPILLLTARAGERDVSYGYDVGADEYMKKPFSPKELELRVEELLARRTRG